MRYADRRDAGERLAPAVVDVVKGPVAEALDAPLDVVVPKKLGAPGNPELGIGAVAPGVRVLDEWLIARLGVSADYLEAEIEKEEAEIARRTERYRAGRSPVDLTGRTAVVVDDGVATGGTAFAALGWVRGQAAARVVFAAPVGPPQIVERLGAACDEVVLLQLPETFFAVGEWYERFDQVTDEEVTEALAATTW
ncbi:MAG: phosphoribosyltransferase [Actinomycetota bacterium]